MSGGMGNPRSKARAIARPRRKNAFAVGNIRSTMSTVYQCVPAGSALDAVVTNRSVAREAAAAWEFGEEVVRHDGVLVNLELDQSVDTASGPTAPPWMRRRGIDLRYISQTNESKVTKWNTSSLRESGHLLWRHYELYVYCTAKKVECMCVEIVAKMWICDCHGKLTVL